MPTCPSCDYDLSGIVCPADSVICPECSAQTTYIESITPPRWTPTLRHALRWLLAVPVIFSVLSWAWLYLGERLSGMVLFYLTSLGFALFLIVYTPLLMIMELHFRASNPSIRTRPKPLAVIAIILGCSAVSGSLLWLSIMDWVEAAANV